jgi:hypothetical protein
MLKRSRTAREQLVAPGSARRSAPPRARGREPERPSVARAAGVARHDRAPARVPGWRASSCRPRSTRWPPDWGTGEATGVAADSARPTARRRPRRRRDRELYPDNCAGCHGARGVRRGRRWRGRGAPAASSPPTSPCLKLLHARNETPADCLRSRDARPSPPRHAANGRRWTPLQRAGTGSVRVDAPPIRRRPRRGEAVVERIAARRATSAAGGNAASRARRPTSPGRATSSIAPTGALRRADRGSRTVPRTAP